MRTSLRVAASVAATGTSLAAAACGVSGEDLRRSLDLRADPGRIRAEAPFAGSKAEKFGDGAAAIVPPKAAKTGVFSRKDVAAAYQTTKKVLVGAYLDRATLLGGKPSAYAMALMPEQRKDFLKFLDHKDVKKDTRSSVLTFGKGEAELVGDVIKVEGKMSAAPRKDEDGLPELRVTYAYRFVYAVRKPGTDQIVRVMAYDKGMVDFWRDTPGGPLRHWIMGSDQSWYAGVKCTDDRFLHPAYANEGGGSGLVQDAYNDDSEAAGDCGSVDEI
ncbi:hypothetical protein [Spongiactinospora sp. TRM90649]|uniref:hypothetical protein n=1 Tax=Spongiactinospora sp. TRM90649 TaxID=3031114 RepID=UPI0023F92241|nr:hypothetical protein [Spongiactinospora sp. TRM90649]MDF5755918.1 hypothetical protein [Spongiactinospora sp. TRM90649]